jgi:hypothetical protein
MRRRQNNGKNAHEKIKAVQEALDGCDVKRLCALAATRGGFVNHALRRRAWLLLLGCADGTYRDDSIQSPPSCHQRIVSKVSNITL